MIVHGVGPSLKEKAGKAALKVPRQAGSAQALQWLTIDSGAPEGEMRFIALTARRPGIPWKLPRRSSRSAPRQSLARTSPADRPMFALAYISRAKQPFDEPELIGLARQAAEKNRRLAVTGYLNFRRGIFFQYLEGEETTVRELMDTIAADERHEVLNVVALGEMPARRFSDWSMRYVTPHEFSVIHLEDVLESVLKTMLGPTFAPPVVQETVLRLVAKIAESRGRLAHQSP